MNVGFLSNFAHQKLVMGKAPILCDIPEWGSTIWVHDMSSGKLSICANEGRWVSYDLNSNRHRVYWKNRCTITVECNVIFSKEDLPRIEDLIVEGVTDEPEGENNDDEISLNRNNELPTPQNPSMPKTQRLTHIKQLS